MRIQSVAPERVERRSLRKREAGRGGLGRPKVVEMEQSTSCHDSWEFRENPCEGLHLKANVTPKNIAASCYVITSLMVVAYQKMGNDQQLREIGDEIANQQLYL